MKTQFICEKCGTRYKTAEAAKDCEASHGDIVEVHVRPGVTYGLGSIKAEYVYVKFRNEKGEEEAAIYQDSGYASLDFNDVKREYGCND